MTLVFCFCSFSSLRSFCATRQTLGGALQGYVCVPSLGVGCILPPCVHFSFLCWVASNFIRYITLFTTETIVPPCGVNGQLRAEIIIKHILQKSLLLNQFHILCVDFNTACQVTIQMVMCMRCKTEWLC